MTELKQVEGGVTVIGDGRSDSPGHSAKYGTYTFMDSNTGKVIDTTVVSVTEVRISKWSVVISPLIELRSNHLIYVAV